MSIYVHIGRVILQGVPVNETRNVQTTMEKELARLLREGGLANELRQGGALSGVRAGTIRLSQGRRPGRLGAQVAGAVYRGIGAPR